MFLHGGGFAFGDLDTHDAQSRRLANRTGRAVLAVDYRRPPEHPFPAAPDDVDTALRWLGGHAAGLSLDPARTATVGDSAGGNLALVAALRNPDLVAACALVYPFVDATTSGASYAATDGGLTLGEAQWYWRQYAATPVDLLHGDLSPLGSDRLGSAPPTYVLVAEHDVLADEDRELARRIEAGGGTVEVETYAGMIHGFWRHPELFDAAEESLAALAGVAGPDGLRDCRHARPPRLRPRRPRAQGAPARAGSPTTATRPSTTGRSSTTPWTTTRCSACGRPRPSPRTGAGRPRQPRRGDRRLRQRRGDRRQQGRRGARRAGVERGDRPLAREHNDANVVSVGGRMHTLEDMTRFVEVFLDHRLLRRGAARPADRDARRLRETGDLPPLPESALHGPRRDA